MPCDVQLVFALVAPIGADLTNVNQLLEDFLKSVGHEPRFVRLTDSFNLTREQRDKSDGKKYYKRLMDSGDELRRTHKNKAAVAMFAVAEIDEIRNGESENPVSVILHQLKTPEEVSELRRIYGNRLVVLAGHSSRENRVNSLSVKLAQMAADSRSLNFRSKAESLISRDEKDDRSISFLEAGHCSQFDATRNSARQPS